MEITELSCNSPLSNIFFKYLDIAGTFTPNKTAIAFCVSQTVSSFKNTSIFIFPFGAVESCEN